MSRKRYIRINESDNVAVALEDLEKGEIITFISNTFVLTTNVPKGHKFTLEAVKKGGQVIKYGYPIGYLKHDVLAGTWINEKDINTNLSGINEYSYQPFPISLDIPDKHLTFNGYRRKNNKVGIRNQLFIVPTVGCVNGIVKKLEHIFKTEELDNYRNIEAVIALTHSYGCSQLGPDYENTRKILRDITLHPNAGGVLVVGLGCENNQPKEFKKFLGEYDDERIKFMICQDTEDEVQEGMKLLKIIAEIINHDQREPISLSELKVGLKCGGSDGFSGITANPLLGKFSDWLISQGGTTVLTEVPEMFGAETILMNRCKNEKIFQQTVSLINDFKDYFLSHGEPIGENPSPGNKAGGISTLEEKSLGCVQKCGKSKISGVLQYGETLQKKGLYLLSSPGNDLVSSTALAASGCQIVLFTTGRGTPFGTFVPTVKISTNNILADNKHSWIDFNAGVLLEDISEEKVLSSFINKIIQIASGLPTSNEVSGYIDMAIFKNGIIL